MPIREMDWMEQAFHGIHSPLRWPVLTAYRQLIVAKEDIRRLLQRVEALESSTATPSTTAPTEAHASTNDGRSDADECLCLNKETESYNYCGYAPDCPIHGRTASTAPPTPPSSPSGPVETGSGDAGQCFGSAHMWLIDEVNFRRIRIVCSRCGVWWLYDRAPFPAATTTAAGEVTA